MMAYSSVFNVTRKTGRFFRKVQERTRETLWRHWIVFPSQKPFPGLCPGNRVLLNGQHYCDGMEP